jgi:hypothetical protein
MWSLIWHSNRHFIYKLLCDIYEFLESHYGDVKPKTPGKINKEVRLEAFRRIAFLFLLMRYGSRDSHDAPSTKKVFFVNVKQFALFTPHDFSTGLEVNIVHS